MRIMITAEQAKFLKQLLDAIEVTSDTKITIGTNLDVDGTVTSNGLEVDGNAAVTGGVSVTGAVVAANVPDTSELEDGSYVLIVTVAEGVASYEWTTTS